MSVYPFNGNAAVKGIGLYCMARQHHLCLHSAFFFISRHLVFLANAIVAKTIFQSDFYFFSDLSTYISSEFLASLHLSRK